MADGIFSASQFPQASRQASEPPNPSGNRSRREPEIPSPNSTFLSSFLRSETTTTAPFPNAPSRAVQNFVSYETKFGVTRPFGHFAVSPILCKLHRINLTS